MPKLELKTVTQELEKEMLRPLYWIYGPERWKARELLKKIRLTLSVQWEETLDGSTTSSVAIIDSMRSPPLGGGIPFIIVRDAHALKKPELLAELFGPPQRRSQIEGVCVCFSKDLDGRKKFSKSLIEGAAVVACDEVVDGQKETWVRHLAQKRELVLSSSQALRLSGLDPWSLDRVEQELEKIQVGGGSEEDAGGETGNGAPGFLPLTGGAEVFVDLFFSRDLQATLPRVTLFADSPEESLPLLGLLGWNVRQLALWLKGGASKPNPYLGERLQKWGPRWKLDEVIELQVWLTELDFHLKQTPLLPLGLWTSLVNRFGMREGV